jgi:hypothetical protein
MPNPGDYFADPAEKLIAETAWAVAANPALDQWTPVSYMSFWQHMPQTHNQIVLARAWMTEQRETANPDTDQKDGGIWSMRRAIENIMGAKDVKVTPKNVANVEHFYSSALISTVGGLTAGPVLAGAASVIWELAVGPYALVVVHTYKTDWTKQDALDTVKIIGTKIVNGMVNNYNQVTGPDQRGIQFAVALGLGAAKATQDVKKILKDYYDTTGTGPPLNQICRFTKVTSRKYKVQGGEALSLLAKWFYNGEMWRWPVIYQRNRDIIGPNYNMIREGAVIEIPLPWEMTDDELNTARTKHKQWNKEGRW